MSVDIQRIKDQVLQYSDQLERVKTEVRKVLIGQDQHRFQPWLYQYAMTVGLLAVLLVFALLLAAPVAAHAFAASCATR